MAIIETDYLVNQGVYSCMGKKIIIMVFFL